MVSKLSAWNLRQTLRAEGTVFEYGDFRILVANLLQGTSFRGLLIEIEYVPCLFLQQAKPIIQSFMQQLNLPPGRLSFGERKSIDETSEFKPIQTASQYLELMRLR